jgi:Concanavalin A-like lectin/glucanases superfamily
MVGSVIGARLKNDGTLLTAGSFDEYGDVHTGHKVTRDTIFADELDEITLPAGQPAGGSIKLNGSSQMLTVSGSGDFQFGNNAFTVEGWFYTTATSYQRLWSFPDGDNVEMLGSVLYYWNGAGAPAGSGSGIVPQNQWFHVALVKTDSTHATVYVNGKSVITDTTPFNSLQSRALAIGGEVNTDVTGESGQAGVVDGYLVGQVTNFRVVKGVAVYTGNFNTPIAPFNSTQHSSVNIAAITGSATKLLLNVASSGAMLTDGSSSAKSVTNVGSATYDALTPLSITYNGAMKQQRSGELLVKNEFDEVTGIV